MSTDVSEVSFRLSDYIKQNAKSYTEICTRLDKLDARVNSIPELQSYKLEIETRIDELVGEIGKIRDLNVNRLTLMEARLNELHKEQLNEASKEEVAKIEIKIDELVGEIGKIRDLNVYGLNKMEARLNELPKEQFTDFITKLIEDLQSLLVKISIPLESTSF